MLLCEERPDKLLAHSFAHTHMCMFAGL